MSLLLLIVLIVGVIMGIIFSLGWVLRCKRQTASVRRELNQLEQEVANLRSISFREET